MNAPVADATRVALEPDALYWALVRPSSRRPGAEELAFLLEPALPVALDDVHPAFARTPGGAWVGCAIPRARLAQIRDRGALEAHPASIPGWLCEEASLRESDAASIVPSLELLTGDFEPPRIRRARRIAQASVIVGTLLIATVSALALVRRARAWEEAATTRRAAVNELIRTTLGDSSDPPRLQLERVSRELERTRNATLPLPAERDAGVSLAAALASWPEIDGLMVDQVDCDATTIRLRGRIPDAGALRAFENALDAIDGWQARPASFSDGSFELSIARDAGGT